MANRPDQSKLLEAAFHRAREQGRAHEFIADGIQACIQNAISLANEFSCLAAHGFDARAQFAMATGMEELGKALILFDFVRIPWEKKDWITRLCKAFYNHVKKAGYSKTVFWPGSGAIADALLMFKIQLIDYWLNADPESGEPDEYAAGIVDREWALYVDWSDFDGRWFSPLSSTLAYMYAQEKTADGKRVGEEKIATVLSQLVKANEEGLFSEAALSLVHSVLPQLYVTANTSEKSISDLVGHLGGKLTEIGVRLSDDTLRSNFLRYPLYAVILTPEQIKGYWEQ